MLRAVLDKRLICAAFFPFGSPFGQISDGESAEVSSYRVTMDKLKNMMFDAEGHPSKELQSVMNVTVAGTSVGFLLGGVRKTSSMVDTFKRENQATLFVTKYDAQKQLHIRSGTTFVRGGLPLAGKLGLFCFLFSSISTSLHLYRRKYDMLNHICGGALTGFLFKMNMGLKGAVAGTVLGTILGTVSGAITMGLLFITGSDMNNVYQVNSAMAYARRDKIKEKSKEFRNEEDERLRKMYEDTRAMNVGYKK